VTVRKSPNIDASIIDLDYSHPVPDAGFVLANELIIESQKLVPA
jgi:hypothetical protein